MSISKLPVAEHGQFIVHHNGPYSEGEEAQLKCEPGYSSDTLVSRLVRDGTGQLVWFPAGVVCEPMTLSHLPKTEYGQFIVDHDPPYKLGDTAELQCTPPHESEESSSIVIMETSFQLAWDPAFIPCGIPYEVPFIYNSTVFFHSIPGIFFEGHVVVAECERGYTSKVDTIKVIVEDNQLVWDPPIVYCEPIRCPLPRWITEHGKTVSSGEIYGSTLRYECDAGYTLMEKWRKDFRESTVNEYFCSHKAKWEPKMPPILECSARISSSPETHIPFLWIAMLVIFVCGILFTVLKRRKL